MKKALIAILAVFVPVFLFSEPLSMADLFDEETTALLHKEGKIQRSTKTSPTGTYSLMPNTELAHKLLAAADRLPESDKYFVESLYMCKKETSGDYVPFISKILRSFTSLEGIEYYSNTAGKYKVLYEDSYRITADGQKLPDPSPNETDEESFLVYQKDTTFGENMYEYSYFDQRNEVGMVSVNVSNMKYKFITVLSKENLVASVLAYDTGDEILLYIVMSADFLSLPGFGKVVDRSFAARSDALFDWFKKQLEQIVS